MSRRASLASVIALTLSSSLLGGLAQMGFHAAIGMVARVWEVTPLEVIGSEVIPAVADL